MILRRLYVLFLVISFTSVSLPVHAQQTIEVDPVSIETRLAGQPGINGKLAVLETALAEIQKSKTPDLGLFFDLGTLRLELLLKQDKQLEAADQAAQLAQIAISQRQILNRNPLPFLRRAAVLYEEIGKYRNAIGVLEAELNQRLEGGQSGEEIARVQRDLAHIAKLQGNASQAEKYLALAEAALAPTEAGTRSGEEKGYHEVDVFYATDRKQTGETEPSDFYGYDRGDLEFGIVSVTIPDTHVPGAIETPSIWKLEFGPEPAKHIMVQKVEPQAADEYFARMQSEMKQRDRKEAFVFIHGFNTSFDAAAKRAAQLAYDMDYRGVPVLYSWPSAGKTFMYVADTAVVRLSGRRLYAFLQDLKSRSGADVIHIVAHSMGNRALTDALELLATKHTAEGKSEPIFGQVFFAAPDVDAGLFREMLDTIRPLAQRMTLYTSQEDWALVASRKLHGDAPRAGQAGQSLLTSEVFDTIDMSALGEDMLAHTYFANDSSALADIMSLIWLNAAPDQRCGLQKVDRIQKASSWKYEKGSCPDTDVINLIKLLWGESEVSVDQIKKQIKAQFDDPARIAAIEAWLDKLPPVSSD
ncbi:alpha/beta hydrolase [Roseibium sp. SCP14]|uniref:alpha/beta hydrolase n=1 Tax=Roseibium sp. SCP14 TaxID=3141375 RepID=UPI00333A6ECA